MKNKNNFSLKPIQINKRKSFQEKPNNSKIINIENQTTDPSTSNVQDIFQKQKKLYDEMTTLSTNLNLNNDQNENTISYTTSNKNNFNQILTGSYPSKSRFDLNQNSQREKDNNINMNKIEKQKDKLDELINKFNNLYSSDSDIKQDEYHTIRNINLNNKGNNNINNNTINSTSTDKINSRHLYKKYHNIINNNNGLINKSSDDLNSINKRNLNNPKRIILNSLRKNNTDLIQNDVNNYYSKRNKILRKPKSSAQSTNKIKLKSNSSSQVSKDIFKSIKNKKMLNDYYSSTNLDNNTSELSTMSLKANMVINEFKKTLLEAEKIENELNKSKYSMNTYGNGNNMTNDMFNINNNLNLNSTNTDINNTQNSFFNPNINNNLKNTINSNNNNYMNMNNNLDTNLINEDDLIQEEDEIEKIKIQNQILLKSNAVLKNQNKILSYEINTYKNSSLYKNPFSQYDKELNTFIQDLKNSLENATQTNISMQNMINKSEKENQELKEKNNNLMTNLNNIKDECEKIVKENSQLKFELENKLEEINTKNENINEMNKQIDDYKNTINNSKNQIIYLKNIKESNKISQKDNEEIISQLKETIDNLQKLNLENNNEIIELKNKLDTLKDSINSKNDTILNLNEEIKKKELEIQNKESQINENNKTIQEINQKNIQNKNDNQKIQVEKEKLKNEIKTIKMVLAEREHTISELKNSISFLTKTFNKNMNIINYNINSALMKEENNNLDVNQSLKELVNKMQGEINELNKRNKEALKEKKKLEKEINSFNEQYEQIKSEYQILYQKYLEQNRSIEAMRNEFIKNNNSKEIQKLTKANFDLLAKYKKEQNENIIKSQQLEQFKKNYKILNSQLMDFTANNYNTNSYNSLEYNNEESNNNSEIGENNNINKKDIMRKINNDIKLMESLNMDDNNLLQYSTNDNNINIDNDLYKQYIEGNNNLINVNISQNENDINNLKTKTKSDKIEKINNDNTNINIMTEENLMNSMNTDKYKLTTEENDKNNNSQEIKDIKNKILLTDKEKLSPEKEKYNLSTQINMKKLNFFNNGDNLESNDFHSKTFPSSLFNNKYTNNLNDSLEDKNIMQSSQNTNSKDNNIISYSNIYTVKQDKIINFYLPEKKFILINPIDNTNGLYQTYITKCSYFPLTLNTALGFFILLNDFIFYYEENSNTINILTKILSSHINSGFIFINEELYSISGKDTLSCEKYSLKKEINIKLPNVNYQRINSGLCNINNEYLYVFFGEKCSNSIERLNLSIDYESMKEYINSWECIKIYSVMENGKQIGLEKFTAYLDDYNNVIILGGNDEKGKQNQDIYGLNLENNEINAIGKIDTCALYLGQNIQLNDSIFAIYDMKNGLHFFNKELDYHEIYNFNL